jgi:hypothetical protein
MIGRSEVKLLHGEDTLCQASAGRFLARRRVAPLGPRAGAARTLPEGSHEHKPIRGTVRSPGESAMHGRLLSAGSALTRAFLKGEAGAALRRELEEARGTGSSVALGIEISDEPLLDLPWETLQVPEEEGSSGLPLVLHPQVSLYRFQKGDGPSPAIRGLGGLTFMAVQDALGNAWFRKVAARKGADSTNVSQVALGDSNGHATSRRGKTNAQEGLFLSS